jgi:hypothetical protein
MMGTDIVPETSVMFNQRTQLIAREDLINFSLRESFRSYISKTGSSYKITSCTPENKQLQTVSLMRNIFRYVYIVTGYDHLLGKASLITFPW